MSKFYAPFVLSVAALLMSCGETVSTEDTQLDTRQFPLEGPCMVTVDGIGTIDVEEDYLPGVVACENGNAPYEALKAQAVQARGFLYYKLFVARATSVSNSQGDQVYRCTHVPNGPSELHKRAVRETKGQYLTWKGKIIAPFYVAGAKPPNPNPDDPINSCKGNGGADGTDTEKWVTYNWGKSNCDIKMTGLGLVTPDCNDNPNNRGCASQNGESCLANTGMKYVDMFEYYYGDDIELVNSTGMCGGPAPKPVTDYDRFCSLKADGNYCFDAATRVQCAGEYAADNELCAGACVDGVCMAGEEPTPTSCSDAADGAYCLDNITRIECAAGALSATEICESGCFSGQCSVDPLEGGNNGTNNGTPVVVDPGTDDFGKQEPLAGFPSLVSPSSGTQSSCSTGFGEVSLLALGALGLLRRRRG